MSIQDTINKNTNNIQSVEINNGWAFLGLLYYRESYFRLTGESNSKVGPGEFKTFNLHLLIRRGKC